MTIVSASGTKPSLLKVNKNEYLFAGRLLPHWFLCCECLLWGGLFITRNELWHICVRCLCVFFILVFLRSRCFGFFLVPEVKMGLAKNRHCWHRWTRVHINLLVKVACLLEFQPLCLFLAHLSLQPFFKGLVYHRVSVWETSFLDHTSYHLLPGVIFSWLLRILLQV